jgi:hypothetical protein
MRISKMATLELQRKGALDLANALFSENEKLKKQVASLEVSDDLLDKANDELTQYTEENYDLLYANAFLKEDFTDLKAKIDSANKILDEIEPDHVLYQYWTVMFKELREVLALNENHLSSNEVKKNE